MSFEQQQYGRSAMSNRRPSFSGPPPNFPPINDQFHNNNQFNDFPSVNDQFRNNQFDNGPGFPEVSGPPPLVPPPPFPPSGPPFPPTTGFDMSSSSRGQSIPPSGGGFMPGPYPPPGGQSFSANTREQRPSPTGSFPPPSSFDPIGPPPPPHTAFNDYNDLPPADSYFPSQRARTHSSGAYGPPPFVGPPMPLSQYPSQYNSRRSRRASTSGAYAAKEPYQYDGMQVKFRVKGSHRNGISLSEAVGNVRLSSSNAYTFRDLNTDSRGRVRLIVRWTGYRSGSYEIPISGYSDGRTVDLQSLARRITRGVVHFLSANHISIPWDRVVLHRLEETSVGTWMPVLTTY